VFPNLASGNGAESDAAKGLIQSRSEPDSHVQEVVKQAHEELLQLLQSRAELMKRIGILKQTIAGLVNLFGDGVLNEEVLQLVSEGRDRKRRAGFTDACRRVLMEARQPLTAVDVLQGIEQRLPQLLTSHKDPIASITTVLNRLVGYGEAEAVVCNGRRAWRWAARDE
jgi:chorismate mutase